jgi:hypothetical protein
MWINLDELLGLPKVTVVNYREIDGALFLKLKMKNEVMECPNCHNWTVGSLWMPDKVMTMRRK